MEKLHRMSKKSKNASKNSFTLEKEFKPRTINQNLYVRSMIENDITFCTGMAGTGKAQPVTSKIMTPEGAKRLADLKVGDDVCTPDGGYAPIKGIFKQGVKPVFRVTFSDGTSTLCCKEHLWKVQIDGKDKVLSLEEMIKNGIKSNGGKRRYKVQLTEPVHFDHQNVEMDPYLLGVLIGDGHIVDSVSFSTADKQIVDYVTENINSKHKITKDGKYDYNIVKNAKIYRNEYKTILKKYKLQGTHSYNKFIPKEFLYNSIEVRLEILRGLLDTDGCIADKGHIEYSTSSTQLKDDIIFLVQSLGGLARVTQRIPKYTYRGIKKDGRVSYRIYIRFNNDIIPFKLDRKVERLHNRTKYFPARFIESVKREGKQECLCIYVDNDEHLYLTNDFIVTHNTACCVGLASSWLYEGKISRIVITRPIVETSKKGLGFLPGNLLEKVHPYLIPILDEMNTYFHPFVVEKFLHDGVIDVVPLEYMRGRNFHDTFMILDEAQNASFEQIKMFLTRIGKDSKCVLNGDIKQTDLYGDSALDFCMNRLVDVEGVGVVRLGVEDIQRNGIISKILAKLE